ncbi:MAG: redoxin domain-containing protein, partial [Phycisphaerales bacterium]|nr:redoxin domain-containing protein [Phycisphaerales bacterium]
VTPGRMVITVHLAGHAPQLREVQVTAAEEVSADFALTEARAITGKLVDPDDKPVADAYIRATRWSGHDTLGLQTMADDAGAFQIIDAPNDAFEIAIYAPGFKPLLDQAIAADMDAYTYQLALDPRKGPGIGSSGPAEGSDAPDFTVTTLDGTKITLSELRGKVVLIDFWATWCGPCVGEIPNLVATREAHGSRDDFVMLSISIEGDTARVKEFTEARKLNWLQAVGDESGAEDAAERYEVNAIPALFLINRDGKIAARDLRGPTIRTQVGELLSQETVTNEKQ